MELPFEATDTGRRLLLGLVLLSFCLAYLVLGHASSVVRPAMAKARIDLPGTTQLAFWLGAFLWRHWYILILAVAVPLLTEARWGRTHGQWLVHAYLVVLCLMLLLGYVTALLLCMPFVDLTPRHPPWC